MVGEAVDIRQRPAKVAAAPLLRVHDAWGTSFRNVNLDVRPGEVVGVCGLAGSGQEDFSAALFGAIPLSGGAITWKGRPYRPRHPADARNAGVAYVPPDRRRQGLVPSQGIIENLTLASLGSLATAGWIDQPARRRLAATWCRRFEVVATTLSQRINTLSGGNQQKVLLARWAARDPELFILNEPTREST